jgi:hypothetical protein
MNKMSITKKNIKWHGTNGTSLRKFKLKLDSYLGVKRNFGPKKGGKQNELAGTRTCSKCIPKGWLVVVVNMGNHDPIRVLKSCNLGLRFLQSLSFPSRTLIGIPLIKLHCYDQGARLGKKSCQLT